MGNFSRQFISFVVLFPRIFSRHYELTFSGTSVKFCYSFSSFTAVSLLNYVPYALSRLTCLCAFVSYVPYAPSCFTCLTHVPYQRVLRTFFTRLATSYLCALKSFQDGFVVQQELFIFQGLLKSLQTVLFLCGSKTALKLLKQDNFLSIFKA